MEGYSGGSTHLLKGPEGSGQCQAEIDPPATSNSQGKGPLAKILGATGTFWRVKPTGRKIAEGPAWLSGDFFSKKGFLTQRHYSRRHKVIGNMGVNRVDWR